MKRIRTRADARRHADKLEERLDAVEPATEPEEPGLRLHWRPAREDEDPLAPERQRAGPAESSAHLVLVVHGGEPFEPYSELVSTDGKMARGPFGAGCRVVK
jgi:hypothetical protein